MGNVYVYAKDATDFACVGLVGALTPTECHHEEVGNGASELTLVHPVDEWGRYAALQPDCILRAPVPVRTCPEIAAGQIVTSVETWTVKATAAKGQRYVFSKLSGGKKKRLLRAGTVLTVTAKADAWPRYRVVGGGTSGWIDKTAISYVTSVSAPATPDGIEVAEPAWPIRDQLFRIVDVKKSESGDSVTVVALRLFYDLRGNLTNYKTIYPVTALAALGEIMGKCVVETEFEAYTDIAGERVGVDWARMNPVKALLDDKAGFCARWGAQLVRDDWDIYCLSKAGLDRGVRIEYAKNLTGVDCSENIEGVVTRIIPVGQTKGGGELLLAGAAYWVDSPLIGNYAAPHVFYLKCDGCRIGGSVSVALAWARMQEQAQAMFTDGCDKPEINVSVDFVNLGDSEEYAQYRGLENVYLYDTVQVHHPKLGVDVTAEVIRVVWDCLDERMLSIELGSVKGSLSTAASAQSMVEARLAALQDEMNEVVGLRLEIESTGDALGEGIDSTTLLGRVLRGAVDVTDEFDESLFLWSRVSADPAADAVWTAAHAGMKAVTLTRAADGLTATYQF